MLSDYDCRLLDIDRYKLHLGDEATLKNEFQKLIDDINDLGSLGFHKLVCQIKHDSSFPASVTKKHIRKIQRLITKETALRLSGKFKLSFVPVIYFSENVPYSKDLKVLSVPNSNYIFLELPLSYMPEYVPHALNRLLYSQKLLPVFANFHIYCATYKPDEIDKFISIKNSAFQFDLSCAVLPQNIKLIKQILKSGNTVLIGTSRDHSSLNKSEIDKNIKLLKKSLGDSYYMTLVLRAHAFP